MKALSRLACLIFCSAAGSTLAVELDTSENRNWTPLNVPLRKIGCLSPRAASEIRDNDWTLCSELHGKGMPFYNGAKRFMGPLGLKKVRVSLQWFRIERERGVFDFSEFDKVVDYAISQGVRPWLGVGSGNRKVWPGSGDEFSVGGSMPTTEEGFAAFENFVRKTAEHYVAKGVKDWVCWNEPDTCKSNTVEQIVRVSLITLREIRKVDPTARVAGLTLATDSPILWEKCLKALGSEAVKFDQFVYHGYCWNPDGSYFNVETLKALCAKYAPQAKMWQGENGAPSEFTSAGALADKAPWSEISQAKYDLRRMLGDLGHDVESALFMLTDFGPGPGGKGLLRSNGFETIAVKKAYYAVQNLASVFDDTLVRNAKAKFSEHDKWTSHYEYDKSDGRPVLVFWEHGDIECMRQKTKGAGPDAWWRKWPTLRPTESLETRPYAFIWGNGHPLEDPVWVDLMTGWVYAFPREHMIDLGKRGVLFTNVPLYDSPCLLTERNVVLH